jgi:hypothetical protein
VENAGSARRDWSPRIAEKLNLIGVYLRSSAADICVSSGLFGNQNRYGPPMNADKRRWKKVIRQLA